MKVEAIEKKSWNTPKGERRDFAELRVDGRVMSCWQKTIIDTIAVGDEIEGNIEEKGVGKTPQIRIISVNGKVVEQSSGGHWAQTGGKKYSDPKTMLISYAKDVAKDVAVACIAKGVITTSAEIKATIFFIYEEFLKKITADYNAKE